MKNVQVIDGAENCTFSIFQMTEEEFAMVFPEPGQDIEFAEDLCARMSEAQIARAMAQFWERPVSKKNVNGIHGTLFYEFERKRHYFPASKRECDWDPSSTNAAQRKLYGSELKAKSKPPQL